MHELSLWPIYLIASWAWTQMHFFVNKLVGISACSCLNQHLISVAFGLHLLLQQSSLISAKDRYCAGLVLIILSLAAWFHALSVSLTLIGLRLSPALQSARLRDECRIPIAPLKLSSYGCLLKTSEWLAKVILTFLNLFLIASLLMRIGESLDDGI